MSAHVRAQLLRFARLTAASLAAEYLRAGGHLPLTWATLWVLLPGTAETALRQALPVKPLPRVTAVPAVPPASPPTGG